MSKLASLRKSLEKKDISTNLSEPDDWVSFGNYSLNYLATGSFYRGLPNRRMVMNFGPSGTGKSLVAGHVARDMQENGRCVIYIDTEDAIDRSYLSRIGVDVDNPDLFMPVRISTIEEMSFIVSDIFKTFEPEDKVGVIVDSFGMLDTADRTEAFDKKGEMKNDMGILAKKLKMVLKMINNKVGNYDMVFYGNQHVYENQNVLDGRGTHVPSGGSAQIYIPSISFMFKKLKLKEDGKVTGIRLKANTEKTRFTQVGMSTELEIPYSTGIDPYSGVLDIIETEFPEILKRSGAWYTYEKNGESVKFQKGNAKDHLDYLMSVVEPSEIIEKEETDVT